MTEAKAGGDIQEDGSELKPKKGEEKDSKTSLMGRATILEISSCSVMVLGTIKGLLSEGELVRSAVLKHDPDIIAVHIGKEELEGLKAVVNGEVKNTYLSSYEKVYARKLSRFGEVQIPPPSLVESFHLSQELDIPVSYLDYGDKRYSSIYTEHVNGMTMIRQSLRLKRVNRKRFRSTSAEQFVTEWDEVSNKLGGYRRVEESREGRMASRIRKLSKRYERILAVVELERKPGIMADLMEHSLV